MTSSHPPIAQIGGTGPGRARTTLLASALATSSAAVAAVLLWHPWPARDQFAYGDIAPVRDATWVGILIDALAFATVGVTLSIVVCLLARHRGAVWASVGAVITTLGGIAYAMGAFGFAAVSWYATDTAALAAADGATLLDYTVDHPEHGMVVQMAGFLAVTIGTIVFCVALLRAKSVPTWLPVAILVATAAQFTPVPQRALDVIQVALMGLLVVVAVTFATVTRQSKSSRSSISSRV